MKKNLVLIFTILAFTQVKAQLIKETAIDITIGYGLSVPYANVDVYGDGVYLQGEYVLTLASWIDIRPYTGLILTKAIEDAENPPEYKSTANAFLIGGKTRITAPIPWVAPYIEFGIGASFGSFETVTLLTNIDDIGLFMHIPVSIGLEIGRKHNFNFAFTYYFHNSAEQFVGAAALGISFPLDSN